MGFNIPLGRIAGIRVTMDPSVLILAVLYTLSLASVRFPHQHPELSTTVYWIAGVSGALLFFVSLLVHEMAHALVARDEGVGVLGISLWFLGGVARLESSPPTAAADFRIAVVGPLSSAAAGVVFLCGSHLLGDTGVAGLTADLFRLLGFINLLLAAFNLLPAAPLDGGTVLSSLIWKRTGSQARGLQVSAYVGVALGVVLVWRGFVIVRSASDAAINGWSLIAVGAFILFAAFRNLRAVPLHRILDGVTVSEAMEPIPVGVPEDLSISGFLRTLTTEEAATAFPVVNARGELSGLLTSAAVRATDPAIWDHLRVGQLAFAPDRLTFVRSDAPLLTAVQRIESGSVSEGVVTDAAGNLVGLVDARALFRTVEHRRSELVTAP